MAFVWGYKPIYTSWVRPWYMISLWTRQSVCVGYDKCASCHRNTKRSWSWWLSYWTASIRRCWKTLSSWRRTTSTSCARCYATTTTASASSSGFYSATAADARRRAAEAARTSTGRCATASRWWGPFETRWTDSPWCCPTPFSGATEPDSHEPFLGQTAARQLSSSTACCTSQLIQGFVVVYFCFCDVLHVSRLLFTICWVAHLYLFYWYNCSQLFASVTCLKWDMRKVSIAKCIVGNLYLLYNFIFFGLFCRLSFYLRFDRIVFSRILNWLCSLFGWSLLVAVLHFSVVLCSKIDSV